MRYFKKRIIIDKNKNNASFQIKIKEPEEIKKKKIKGNNLKKIKKML